MIYNDDFVLVMRLSKKVYFTAKITKDSQRYAKIRKAIIH